MHTATRNEPKQPIRAPPLAEEPFRGVHHSPASQHRRAHRSLALSQKYALPPLQVAGVQAYRSVKFPMPPHNADPPGRPQLPSIPGFLRPTTAPQILLPQAPKTQRLAQPESRAVHTANGVLAARNAQGFSGDRLLPPARLISESEAHREGVGGDRHDLLLLRE